MNEAKSMTDSLECNDDLSERIYEAMAESGKDLGIDESEFEFKLTVHDESKFRLQNCSTWIQWAIMIEIGVLIGMAIGYGLFEVLPY